LAAQNADDVWERVLTTKMGVIEHLARFVCNPDARPKICRIALTVVAS
jgi:hypothetical protein